MCDEYAILECFAQRGGGTSNRFAGSHTMIADRVPATDMLAKNWVHVFNALQAGIHVNLDVVVFTLKGDFEGWRGRSSVKIPQYSVPGITGELNGI